MQQMIRRSGLNCRRNAVTRLICQFSSESGDDKQNEMGTSDDNGNTQTKRGTSQKVGSVGGGSGNRGEEARGSAISFFRSRQTDGSTNWIKGVKELLMPKKDGDETSSSRQKSVEPSTDGAEGIDKPVRIFNSRKKAGNRGAVAGKRNDAFDNYDEGGGSTFTRSKSRRSNRDEQDDSNDNYNPNTVETVPPNVMLQLFDVEALQHKIEDRMGIDLEGLDKGDQFLAHVLTQCLKNEDGIYREVITSREMYDNLRIPVARPARSLLMAATPDINEDPDSIGYKLGSTAWQTLSQNYYYSEADCKYMSQKVARITNKIIAMAEEDFETDLVLDQGFRKGLPGIEYEERKLELLSEQPDEELEQGETDWDQNAVVDEDDLFDEDEK